MQSLAWCAAFAALRTRASVGGCAALTSASAKLNTTGRLPFMANSRRSSWEGSGSVLAMAAESGWRCTLHAARSALAARKDSQCGLVKGEIYHRQDMCIVITNEYCFVAEWSGAGHCVSVRGSPSRKPCTLLGQHLAPRATVCRRDRTRSGPQTGPRESWRASALCQAGSWTPGAVWAKRLPQTAPACQAVGWPVCQ